MAPHSSTTARDEASSEIEPSVNRYQRAILRTLLYYDLFGFPLRMQELLRFSETHWPDNEALAVSLQALVDRGLITREDQWVHLNNSALIENRTKAEARATRVMPRALRRSRLIGRFPFVRGVALSGTISKGVFAEGDDVDFFVVTAPGRLWICRVLLMGFKKVFLFNSRRTFCINYLVTEDHLKVPDENVFTATEIAWLMPTINQPLFDRFNQANDWAGDILPNWDPTTSPQAAPWRPFGPTRAIEKLLSGIRGDRLDDRCHAIVERHNRLRYSHLEQREFKLALRTAKNVSKHHPQSLQDRILERFDERMQEFEALHDVVLRYR